jgi:hypothetical protein
LKIPVENVTLLRWVTTSGYTFLWFGNTLTKFIAVWYFFEIGQLVIL